MREIKLVKFDDNWKIYFQNEKELIEEFLSSEIINIHHIGSTAIPGILSKPIIDILVEVNSFNKIDEYTSNFCLLGYEEKGEFGIQRRHFFQKGNGNRTHHVHIFEKNDIEILKHIKFRDHLLNSKVKAFEYEALKIKLATKHRFDPDGYSDGKSIFIQSITSVY